MGDDPSTLRVEQLDRLRRLLGDVLPGNRFYARKFADAGVTLEDLTSPDAVTRLPFTTKAELTTDQADTPPYGTNLSHATEQYCRMHQSSGTSTGRPLRWLDCPRGWEFLLNCWSLGFSVMEVTPQDRLFFPFSFGPFLGFWTAFEAAHRLGCLCLPGGGMSSTARLRFLLEHRVTVVFTTPTYALHLAELAAAEGIDLAGSAVRALVVAGEPGGSITATRERIEQVWGARVIDHYGMTEVGPVAFECTADPGSLLILETEYLAEVVEPGGDRPIAAGEVGELILTNLGRFGSPLIRYRTGDLVRLDPHPANLPGVPRWQRLKGGVLGRVDDMIHVRGNNLYPTAIEAVVRRFPEVAEFRIIIDETGPLSDLRIEVEATESASGQPLAEAVARAVRDSLLFRVEVRPVPCGTLPRFEMKAKRVIHERRT